MARGILFANSFRAPQNLTNRQTIPASSCSPENIRKIQGFFLQEIGVQDDDALSAPDPKGLGHLALVHGALGPRSHEEEPAQAGQVLQLPVPEVQRPDGTRDLFQVK